jgi:hypothetical protein
MKRVSVRTLALLVELLIAVIAQQYIAAAARPQVGAVWLARNNAAVQPASSSCPASGAANCNTRATPQ